jgi:hypothetical protein
MEYFNSSGRWVRTGEEGRDGCAVLMCNGDEGCVLVSLSLGITHRSCCILWSCVGTKVWKLARYIPSSLLCARAFIIDVGTRKLEMDRCSPVASRRGHYW